ncbi:MAG: alanine racemase [Mycobacteriales bacterium]
MPGWVRACCEVDLAAIRGNVERLVRLAHPAALCAVVKADGYGHGLLPAARAALAGGASWLAVAFAEEALALRGAGIAAPLLALITTGWEDLTEAVGAQVQIGVGSPAALAAAKRAARSAGVPAKVHLEADTGLARGGAAPGQWAALVAAADELVRQGSVEVVGVWSHLACGEVVDSAVTEAQVGAFREALRVAEAAGLRPSVRHLLNSGGLFTVPHARYDLVRVGIACYGLSPGNQLGNAAELGLRPAMSLRARVALTKRVASGTGVSYGHRYRTQVPTTLALVPVGYADGVPRRAGGRTQVLVGRDRCTISGAVCMDQFVVDVGDARVEPGDEVVLFGPGDYGEPTAEDWAAALDTISYELVTGAGSRLARAYLGEPV